MRPRVAGVALTVFGLAAGLAAGQNQPPPPPIAGANMLPAMPLGHGHRRQSTILTHRPLLSSSVNYASGATDWVKGRNGQYLIVNSQCNGAKRDHHPT